MHVVDVMLFCWATFMKQFFLATHTLKWIICLILEYFSFLISDAKIRISFNISCCWFHVISSIRNKLPWYWKISTIVSRSSQTSCWRDAVNQQDSRSFEGLYRNHLYDSSITGRTAKQWYLLSRHYTTFILYIVWRSTNRYLLYRDAKHECWYKGMAMCRMYF
jgi:hypothetical protein